MESFEPHKTTTTLPTRWFFTDNHRVPDPLKAIQNLDPKVGVVFRDYDRKFPLDIVQKLATQCREKGQVFLIAGDFERANKIKANGVHLRQDMLTGFTKPKDFNGLITAACHDFSSLKLAQFCGVDGVFISPIFTTDSHPSKQGLEETGLEDLLKAFQPAFNKPTLFGLGGMNEENFERLKRNPRFKALRGFGAIGAFLP